MYAIRFAEPKHADAVIESYYRSAFDAFKDMEGHAIQQNVDGKLSTLQDAIDNLFVPRGDAKDLRSVVETGKLTDGTPRTALVVVHQDGVQEKIVGFSFTGESELPEAPHKKQKIQDYVGEPIEKIGYYHKVFLEKEHHRQGISRHLQLLRTMAIFDAGQNHACASIVSTNTASLGVSMTSGGEVVTERAGKSLKKGVTLQTVVTKDLDQKYPDWEASLIRNVKNKKYPSISFDIKAEKMGKVGKKMFEKFHDKYKKAVFLGKLKNVATFIPEVEQLSLNQDPFKEKVSALRVRTGNTK